MEQFVNDVARNCGISANRAEREMNAERDYLSAQIADERLTIEDVEDAFYNLGLDMTDDNLDALLMSLI